MSTIRKHYDKWQSIVRVSGHPALYKSFKSKTDATRWAALTEVKLRREDAGIIKIKFPKFKDNKDDFVILCGVSNGKVKEYFILPTLVVDKTLKESNRIYHLGKKRDGSKRKVTSHRAIFLQESKDHYWCGWRRKWNEYLNNWDILNK